ncbi:MAG: hypothetical protein ACFFD3_07345 [Candidatus Thorarchaeota archaeon]
MIAVILMIVITWLLIGGHAKDKTVVLLAVGLLSSYIVAVLASILPILDIPLENNEAIRVFSPAAFPFSIQQYRNYDAGLFNYTLSLGWPQGFPLIQSPIMDDQSEYIHFQHYSIGLTLGLILLLGVVLTVLALHWADTKHVLDRIKNPISPVYVLFLLQLALIILIVSPLALGSPYFYGGLLVLLLTFYPTIRQFRNRTQ